MAESNAVVGSCVPHADVKATIKELRRSGFVVKNFISRPRSILESPGAAQIAPVLRCLLGQRA